MPAKCNSIAINHDLHLHDSKWDKHLCLFIPSPSIHGQVTACKSRIVDNFDLDLWATDLVHVCNTLFQRGKYLWQSILKSLQSRCSYGLDKQYCKLWPLTVKLTFGLPTWFMCITQHLTGKYLLLSYTKAKLQPGKEKLLPTNLLVWQELQTLVHVYNRPSN